MEKHLKEESPTAVPYAKKLHWQLRMPLLICEYGRIKEKGIMEKLKKCSKCGRELPVSEFWKNASTEDGLQTYCKECGNVYARNRKKTPGKFEENIFQS